MNMRKKLREFFTMTRRAEEGFTLVELIVVIAIVAILGGVAVPAYSGYIEKADRAADAQLLADVNKAFAAACIVLGEDNYKADGATATIDDESGEVTVSYNVTGFEDAFNSFYEGGAFKKTEDLEYNSAIGGFYDPDADGGNGGSSAFKNALQYVLDNFADEIGLVKDSAYATQMGAKELMGAVDGVTGLAAEMLGTEGSTLFNMVKADPNYITNLAGILKKDPAEFAKELEAMGADMDKYLANSTVLSVASTVNSDSYDRAGLANKLASGQLSQVVGAVTSSENGLAEAALIYGLYTAYAPDKASNVTGLNALSGLSSSDPGFMTYLQGLSDPNSQATKDMNGYYAALDVVNGAVSNDPAVADQIMSNGYQDQELVDMIGSVIGG